MDIKKTVYKLGDIAVVFSTAFDVTETVFVPYGRESELNDEKLGGLSPLGWIIDNETQVHVALTGDGFSGDFTAGTTMRNSDTSRALKFKGVTEKEQNGRQILTATYEAESGLTANQIYEYVGGGCIEARTELINNGKDVTVEALPSFNMARISPFERFDDPDDIVIHRLMSNWSCEGKLYSTKASDLELESSWSGLGIRSLKLSQVGSMPARVQLPFIAVEDKKHEVCWAATIQAPSSWIMEVVLKNNALSIGGGMGDYLTAHWRKTLKNGEKIVSPKAFITVADGGLEAVSQRLAKHFDFTDKIKPVEEDMPVMYNEYCYTWGKPKAEVLEKQLDNAKSLGCKYFVIDDGWFVNKYGENNYVIGDWNLNTEYFPQGLKAFSDKVKEYGMTLGVWYEFECVHEASDLYKNHKDWLLTRDGVTVKHGNKTFLDFRKPEVIKYLSEKVVKNLKDNNIGYMKVDYNGNIGLGADGAESYGEGLNAHISAVIEFFKEIKRQLPELVLEVCSSGGMRHEPEFMGIGDMVSFSDAHENPSGVCVAMNLHRYMPPRKMQIWATIRDDYDLNAVKFTVAKAMLGRICFSGNLSDKAPEIMSVLKQSVDFYNGIKDILKNGETVEISDGGVTSYLHTAGSPYLVRKAPDGRTLVYAFAINQPGREFEISCGNLKILSAFNAPENACVKNGVLKFTADKTDNFGCVFLLG